MISLSTYLLVVLVGCNSGLPAVPVVDLTEPSAIAAQEVNAALRRYGFFYVRNHGIPKTLLKAQFEQSRKLFALPAGLKRNLTFVPHLDIGYLGSTDQALDEESGALDQKEGFMLTNNGVFDPEFMLNQTDPLQGATLHWPPKERLPQYESILRSYVQEATRVTHVLNKLLFASLGLSEDDRRSMAAQPFTVLKQMRYARANAHSHELGAGAHADWGTLTVLATDGTPGLQVELDNGWLPVPPREGCLIVNAGDQIAHWTNGEYRSASHRVLNLSPKPRYSTAFFTYFDIDALVTPLQQFVSESQPATVTARTTRAYFHFKLFESTRRLDLLDNDEPSDTNSQNRADVPKCTNAEKTEGSWTLRHLSKEHIGVEVKGVELAVALNSTIDALVEAMHSEGQGVLVVREQSLDPPALQHVLNKFAPHFGRPLRYDRWPGQSQGVPCCPSLSTLGNYRAKERGQFGMECEVGDVVGEFKPARDSIDEWHTDDSFALHPKVAIALYAPNIDGALPEEGGETKFASCARFFGLLTLEEQLHIAGLQAVHSWEVFMRFLEARDPSRPKVTAADCVKHPDVTFPLVRTHPRTGKTSVYINPKNTRQILARDGVPTLNWTREEGLTFIRDLGRRIVDSGVYRHSWRRGDFVIWDNRVLLHAASPFNASVYERLLFRAEFPGEPVLSPAVGEL